MNKKFKIKKGDTVMVMTGRDKGKTGAVIEMRPKDERLLVQGVNLVKRHQKQTQTQDGGIMSIEAPIHISNVALMDDGKATRVGYRMEDGNKVRYAKRTGNTIGANKG